jgi:hypothetical protein
MGGDRRETADRLRMLGAAEATERREFTRHLRAQEAEYGRPASHSLLRVAMMRASTRWVALVSASRALADARRARSEGRGRRPSQREVNGLAKRAALEDASYEKACEQVRELAARHAPAPARPSALEVLQSLPPVTTKGGI